MKTRMICKALTVHDDALDFFLDDDTGEVSGESSVVIAHALSLGSVVWNPMPGSDYELDQDGSLSDLAAVVGSRWELPDSLAEHYPQREDDNPFPNDIPGISTTEVIY